MNIKYITDVRIPTSRAAGYAIMKMCESFSLNGAAVELIIPNKKDADLLGDPFEYYKIRSRFKLRKVRSSDFLSSTWNFGKMLYAIDLATFLLSVRFSVKIEPKDIIYTRDYLVTLIFPKKSVYLELHDIPKSDFLFKQSVKKAKKIFVLTRFIKDSLVRVGANPANIHVIPSGVDIQDFDIQLDQSSARKQLGLPLDKKIVVYTGHLYDWKGVGTLFDAAKVLKEVLFVFVGGVEPEINKFKQESAGLDNVSIVPYLDRSIIPIYLKAADILAIPNSGKSKISSEYTSPLKLFEYMASGRPIVASDLPSMREILNDNNCVFAKPDDAGSFAFAIGSLIEDSDKSSRIAQKSSEDVKKYDWSKRAENILNQIKATA